MRSHSQQAPPATSPPAEPTLWSVWDDVRRSADQRPWLGAAPPPHRWGRFVQGVSLPFQLVRELLAEPTLRRTYLRVALTQAAVIVALAVMFTNSGTRVARTSGAEDWAQERIEQAQDEAEATVAQEERVVEKILAALTDERALPAAERRQVAHELRAAARKQGREKQTRTETTTEASTEDSTETTASRFVYWAALLSSLQLAQWVVIALSRDHHTHLSREVSLRTGLAPEDEPLVPRVRLDVGWIKRQARKRWRALLVFGMGMPVLWAFRGVLPEWGKWLFAPAVSLWGAWWFVVFTAGKSAQAWTEPQARPPWFLRLWGGVPSRLGPLRAYGRWWTRVTHSVFSPAARVEREPWGLSGLALARALSALPLLKCFLRPVIPVAAAHLLAARREDPAPIVPSGQPR